MSIINLIIGLLLLSSTTVIGKPASEEDQNEVTTELPSIEDYEKNASIYITESSHKFFELYDSISETSFDIDSADFSVVFNKFEDLEKVSKNLTELSKEVGKFPYEAFEDETLKIGMENLRISAYLYVLGESYFKNLSVSTKSLKSLPNANTLCEYKNSDNCNKSYNQNVMKIIYDSSDEKELEFYWEEWRKQNEKLGPRNLENFIEWFQMASRRLEVTPLGLWYKVYGDASFLSEMEKVVEQIRPFYGQLHAYIRYQLRKDNKDIITNTDPIPYHLYEQVLSQIWSEHSSLDLPYPNEKLPQFDSVFDKTWTPKKLVDIADEFYQSLGLEELPKKFWANRVKELKESGSHCRADIYDKSPNTYLKYCPDIDFRKFLQIHGWMGRLHYANQKQNLSFAYFQSYNFEIPVGEAVILSASTPKHLNTVGLLGDIKYGEKEQMNRLLKMAVHTMLNIPIYFVHSKVMNDLLSGKVEVANVNQYYWFLLEQYCGLMPPVNRNSASFDFPPKFYEDLENNHQTTKFVSEIAGYQIYRSICLKIKQFMPGDEELPLNMCDWYGNSKAGDALKEMMHLGSQKPWRWVLSKVTGSEAGIKGDAILEYYEPLLNWLESYNKKHDIIVGWTPSSKILNAP